MSTLAEQESLGKRLLRWYLPTILVVGVLTLSGGAWAAGSLVVSPSTNLTNGQTVTVSGSGLAAGSIGSILECNSDASQPTITVAGNAVPVSCSNPLSTLITTNQSGNLPSTSFTVKTGTIGPPGTGTDSSGGSAANDAANYPCPPTAAQLAAGDSCTITYGDAGGDDVVQNIIFAGQNTTTTTPAPTTTTPAPTTTTTPAPTTSTPAAPSESSSASSTTSPKLTNTGPGNTILIFLGTVIVAGLLHYAYTYRYRNKTSH